uniref:Uncharacterized protein n=1 Tax=Arundo donax TaxID=35708 RepID=A0A0A9F3P5_ARUDO
MHLLLHWMVTYLLLVVAMACHGITQWNAIVQGIMSGRNAPC